VKLECMLWFLDRYSVQFKSRLKTTQEIPYRGRHAFIYILQWNFLERYDALVGDVTGFVPVKGNQQAATHVAKITHPTNLHKGNLNLVVL